MSRVKKITLGAIAALTLGLGVWASKAFYTVTNIIDGDTFETADGQHIRINNIDAPELQFCGGDEAKQELKKLLLNKKVFIKVSRLDGYRLISDVYTINGNVGYNLVKKGLVVYKNKEKGTDEAFMEASQNARNKQIGIYSSKCTQITNPANPKCNIKANNNLRLGKNYHTPDCKVYHLTIVQLYFGDRWFCTEKEARKAGFTKGTDCPK